MQITAAPQGSGVQWLCHAWSLGLFFLPPCGLRTLLPVGSGVVVGGVVVGRSVIFWGSAKKQTREVGSGGKKEGS